MVGREQLPFVSASGSGASSFVVGALFLSFFLTGFQED